MRPDAWFRASPYPARFAILTLAYWAAAVLGLQWTLMPGAGASVWPAAGIALTGLLWGGLRLWPAIMLGRVLAGLTVPNAIPPATLILLALGTAAGAALPILWRRLFFRKAPWRPDLPDVLWLILIGAGGGGLASAAFASLDLWIGGMPAAKLPMFAFTWTTGFAVGVLIAGPPLLSLSGFTPPRSFGQILHIAAWLLAAVAVCATVFLFPPATFIRSWLVFPVLVWAGAAFKFRGAAWALLISGAASTGGAILHNGPFASITEVPLNQLLMDQLFVAVCAVTILVLGVVTEERAARSEALLLNRRELEIANQRLQDEIRARRATERELAEAQKLEALGRLAGGIAHDFNNLLMIIRGSVDLVRRDTSGEKRPKHLQAIADASDRAARLTAQMLSFARRQALSPELVDLKWQLDGFSELIGRSIGPGIELRLDLSPDLPPVSVDPTQLEIAVLNLAINARDAMNGQGGLTISAAAATDAAEVVISVADTGPGMDDQTKSRAFDPFFTTKGPGKGTGLGLSQVYGFAVQSGGRAWIETAPGRGLAVRLSLPVAAKAGPPRCERPAPAIAPSITGPVLLVDDNLGVAEFTRELLTGFGYEVALASDAASALAWVRVRGRPGLVITDIVMPGMNGVDLAQALRERWPDLPVVLASGYADVAPAEDWPLLRKPFGACELAQSLAAVLGPQSQSQSQSQSRSRRLH